MTVELALNRGTVFFGFLAAALWFKSTITSVPPDPNSNEFVITETDNGKKTDVLATAKQQVWWNKWAAAATGGAALCQAIVMTLQAI